MATIYYTSDTHSYLYPEDHAGNKDLAMGYGLMSASFSDADLILDGGDVLQGSPLIRYEMKRNKRPFTAAEAFNRAHLDIFVPGNHDFNYGPKILSEFLSELDADIVCANLVDEKWGMNNKDHVIRTTRDGLRIFISGVVSDYVNVWEKEENLEGIKVTDSVEAAARAYEESLGMEDIDFRILIYHGGWDDTHMGSYKENRGDELCAIGYDIMLSAHQHMTIEPHIDGKSLTLQASCKAVKAARITLEKGKAPVAELIDCDKKREMTPEMKALLYGPIRKELDDYLGSVLGHVDGELSDKSKLESAMNGSSLADFINDVQREAVGAELSACSLFNVPVTLSGDVTMGDMLQAYPFANTLVKFRIKAKDLKKAMERAAEYLLLDEKGEVHINPAFYKIKMQHYNYDYWRGVSYTFDLRRPIGERVVRLERNGEDLLKNTEESFTMVVNSYRATGTGGYDAYRSAEVLERPAIDVQDVILDAFDRSGSVKVPEKTDFRVIY